MPILEINRCVCNNLYFVDLLKLAKRNNWDLESLLKFTGAGDKCGMCIQYIKELMENK